MACEQRSTQRAWLLGWRDSCGAHFSSSIGEVMLAMLGY